MSDRIAVMNAGRIHHLAPPEEIYDRPATRFVLDFVGSVNYIPCTVAGSGSGRMRLAVAGGAFEIAAPASLPTTTDLTVAIRPEDLELSATGPDDAPRAQIALRSFVGEGFEYRLDLQGQSLRARTEKSVQFDEGTEVVLQARRGVLVDSAAGQDSTVAAA